MTDAAALQALASRLHGIRIDTLICNAGVLAHDNLSALDFARIEEQLAVNALGPLRTVAALQGNLAQGGKLALITSRMDSISDNRSGSYYGYRMSKAARMLIARIDELSLETTGRFVHANGEQLPW